MDFLTLLVLVATLLAVCWYTLETRWLRQWQTKQVQLEILKMDIERIAKNAEGTVRRIPYSKEWPILMREIYELGKFDVKDLYSKAYHKPLSK